MKGELGAVGWGKARGTQRLLHPSSSQVLFQPYLPLAPPDLGELDRVGCASPSLEGHEEGQAPAVARAPLVTLPEPTWAAGSLACGLQAAIKWGSNLTFNV